jgi:hypothetical protein
MNLYPVPLPASGLIPKSFVARLLRGPTMDSGVTRADPVASNFDALNDSVSGGRPVLAGMTRLLLLPSRLCVSFWLLSSLVAGFIGGSGFFKTVNLVDV